MKQNNPIHQYRQHTQPSMKTSEKVLPHHSQPFCRMSSDPSKTVEKGKKNVGGKHEVKEKQSR